MKFIVCIALVAISCTLTAQDLKANGENYRIENETIFKDGKDITNTLSQEERVKIKEALREHQQIQQKAMSDKLEANNVQKTQKRLENRQKKTEKKQKKAEKKQKNVEKKLKQKVKAQDRYDKLSKQLEKSQKKYDKLNKKGKLSPEENAKWLEKIKKQKSRLTKAEKRMKRA